MTGIKDKVSAYVNKWHMLERQDYVIVGVSGGADSVCLLCVLVELQKEIEFSVRVVHVNHGLRIPDADADEAYVEDLCGRNKIPFTTYHYDVELIAKKRKQSTEEAGRILRREAFADAKIKYHGTKIAMAHHKNDNVETLFLNLARGTGLKGLGGILPVRADIIRPLLCVERQEIENYLEQRSITYCTDLTNKSNVYTRNKIRNCVIPYLKSEINPQVVEHANQTMEQMQELQLYMKGQTEQCYLECVSEKDGMLAVQGEIFNRMPSVLQKLLVQKCLESVAGQEQNITNLHIKQVQDLIKKQVGKQISLPYQMIAYRTYEGILLDKASNRGMRQNEGGLVLQSPGHNIYDVKEDKSSQINIYCRIMVRNELDVIPQKTYTKWFDYDIIKNSLVLRTRRTGDYITIDKEGRRQKLKSYFVNCKIPENQRDEVFLVVEGSHVLWIVGYRMSSVYQVNENTKRILEIQIDGGYIDGRDN